MAVCPKCKKPVDENAKACSACGHELKAQPTGTLDVGGFFDKEQSSEAQDASSEVPAQSEKPEPKKPTGKKRGKKAKPAKPVVIKPEASKPAKEEVKGTLGVPEIKDPAPADPSKTKKPAAPTVQLDETIDSVDLKAEPPSDDADGTVTINSNASQTSDHGTHEYGDEDLSAAQQGNGKSGTAGRLKRLWQGAAGSSANPMHTLKGDDALATDSVFAKVARRVLVTDTAIEIAASAGSTTASQVDKKARVEECISIACRGGDDESADYDLTGFLGQGGMGVVLKARQRAIGRDVAIKMIQPSSGKSTSSSANSQKKKFFYEAQITGKLDHPNIVPIYEMGISNEILFYSMKMIIGTEWKDVISKHKREDNLDIFMKVADAMAFAHQKKIIHRDLKPENVMLGPFGEVLVTDWGCAIDLSRKERFTGAGSPPWMAPEMADHNISKIGPRSDIYLLGAMLYQVIAGYPPHPGQTVFECIEAAQKNIILPLDIEDPLLDIALRAMETQPDDRYQTVEAMQDAIREYRRHAESITLCDRSEALLAQAIETKDYERFSRTIFGFQDAVELWPGNTAAVTGLATARMAYGQCAFDKGDYDLCLQSLDRSIPAEAELYLKAEKAKKASEERESRFKSLRRVLAAVILVGLGVSTVLAGVAWVQKGRAEFARNEAVTAQRKAEDSAESERIAKQKAEKAADDEAIARRKAETAEGKALKAAKDEAIARKKAETAEEKALKAAKDEAIARNKAVKAQMEAEENFAEAEKQKGIAKEETAQRELGIYQNKLALSLAQIKQRDVANADSRLNDLVSVDSYEALNNQDNQPKFDNWALKRVELLSNNRLLTRDLFGNVSAVAYATKANLGVVASVEGEPGQETGKLQIVTLKDKRPQVERAIPTEARVTSVSISPNGDEIIYSLAKGVGDKNSAIYSLSLSDAESQPAKVAEDTKPSLRALQSAASLQAFVMTEDKVIGGLNGGLWVWSRAEGNWQDSKPTQINSVRGRLQSLQLLDDSRALVLAEFDGGYEVHLIDLKDPTRTPPVQFSDSDSEFSKDKLTAVAYSKGNLILGTESGQLFTATMAPNATKVGPEYREVLPQQHQSAISSIRVETDGTTMLTTASEPVVNVWKASTEQLSGWQFDTDLAGTPENVGGAAFMNTPGLVLGVGENGNAIVWDVQRQKQRQQLVRVDADGKPRTYDSPVIEVVTSNDEQRAVSIHSNGLVESWNLITGEVLTGTQVPETELPESIDAALSYVGHSPGASFVDMAIDEPSGTLITSALMPSDDEETAASDAGNSAKKSQEQKWEFCKWDLNSGKMMDRWTEFAAAEQEISLARKGELILYARNNDTLIKEARRNGQTRFDFENLGSFFGVVHPTQENLMITVKSNGSARMLDLSKPDGGIVQIDYDYNKDPINLRNSGLRSDDESPLVGAWAPAGDRFYMVWESGRITELVWENQELYKGRDLQGKQLQDLGIDLSLSSAGDEKAPQFRLSSRWQVDLKVRSQDNYNLLYLGIRFPGSEGRVRLARVAFPQADGQILVAKDDKAVDKELVLSDQEMPAFERGPASQVPVPDRDIVATRAVGAKNYVATESGTVYQVSASGVDHVFGRPQLLSACGNLAANRVVTLHEGGVLWQADLVDDVWTWQPLTGASGDSQKVAMSPDGKQLLLTNVADSGATDLVLLDVETGNAIETIAGASCSAWNAEGDLAIVGTDGSVRARLGGVSKELGKLESAGNACSVHFFIEPWNDPAKLTNHWLVVHTEPAAGENTGSQIQYFSLDAAPAADAEPAIAELASGMNVLACSPTDGIFVVGGKGTVEIHFASPTLGQYGEEQLFSLEGHAGAAIESLTFSRDGKTLISSDSLNRLFGWLSEDPLNGISVSPEGPAMIQ